MTLAGQISPSHGAVWSLQEVGRSESGHFFTKCVKKSGENLTYVGGMAGFMYYVVYTRGRAGTRARDRVGVKMTDAKTIWPYPHNAPLSEREHNKLISKAKRILVWVSTGRKTETDGAGREGERKGGRAFGPRTCAYAREQLPPPPPIALTTCPAPPPAAGLTGHPLMPPVAHRLACPATRPAACPSVGVLPVPCSDNCSVTCPVPCPVIPLTSIPPNCSPISGVKPRQTRKP